MRITAVETIPLAYEMPYPSPMRAANIRRGRRCSCRVHTSDASITGWGEAAMWGGPHSVSAKVIEEEIAPSHHGGGSAPTRISLGEGLPVDLLSRPQGHADRLPVGCRHRALGYRRQMRGCSRCGASSAVSPGRSPLMPRPVITAATMALMLSLPTSAGPPRRATAATR